MEILLAVAVSFAVGAVSAVFGVGGGFILVPVLNAVLGVPMHLAVGSAACYVLGPATTALLYRDTKLIDWRLPLIFSGGIFFGVILGTNTLSQVAAAQSEGSLLVDYLILGTYFALLSTLGLFGIWESYRAELYRPLPRGWVNDWTLPPTVVLAEWNAKRMSLPILSWFGLVVGFLSGLLGISGGLLILPGLLYLFALPAQASVTCSMILVWIVSFQSTIAHAVQGNIELWLVAALLAGGTIGARIGTSVGKRLGSQQLRKSFGILALSTAIFVLARMIALSLS